jgi:hypothetical protein
MASIISPKNVGKLVIASAVASETTNTTFVATASIGEVQVVKADGSVGVANLPFKVVQKKDASLTGVDFSDTIDPKQIDYVKLGAYQAEVPKIVAVSGFTGNAIANATYRVSIRKFDGIQSPENFRHVHGFVVTPALGVVTHATVLAELVVNLNASLKREDALKEMEASVSGTTLVVTGKVQAMFLGKDAGDAVQFDVEVSVKDNSPASLSTVDAMYSILTIAVTQGIKSGVGTGKQVALAEYSLKGYENGDYGREMGFPNNFNVSYSADKAANYNTVVIGFHKDRDGVNIERQFKELTVVMPFTDLASNAAINAFLARLRVVAPSVSIPADLAVV